MISNKINTYKTYDMVYQKLRELLFASETGCDLDQLVIELRSNIHQA